MILPAEHNLTIYQGASFEREVFLKDASGEPVTIPGASIVMVGAEAKKETPLFTLSTSTGEITFDSTSGLITITMEESVTEALSFVSGTYDLFVTSGGDTNKILQGQLRLIKSVIV